MYEPTSNRYTLLLRRGVYSYAHSAPLFSRACTVGIYVPVCTLLYSIPPRPPLHHGQLYSTTSCHFHPQGKEGGARYSSINAELPQPG